MVEGNSLTKTIVFLVYWPISAREVENWGFSYLKLEGFDVQVWDLSIIMNRQALLKNPPANEINEPYVHKFESYGQVSASLRNAAPDTVFLDYIVHISDISFKTIRFYHALKKASAKFCVVYSGALPTTDSVRAGKSMAGLIADKIMKASNIAVLADYCLGRATRFFRKYTDMYPWPERIFATAEADAICRFFEIYPDMKRRLVPINSYDYDRYLQYLKGRLSSQEVSEKICVFLDEGLTDHPDYEISGGPSPLDAETYIKSLNRLFDRIESASGLKVVVASHPKSHYEDRPLLFGGREIVKGRTLELVAHCSMVVLHFSTAVSFAVLFQKPILVVKTRDMSRSGFANSADIMAWSLGMEAIDIDEPGVLESLRLDYNEWPNERYESYLKKYIVSDGVEGFNTWEIVARELKGMAANE